MEIGEMNEKLELLIKLHSGELELGDIDIEPELYWVWLKAEGFKEFGFRDYPSWESFYRERGNPIDTIDDIKSLILRMKNKKDGRLILAKAMTEIKFGNLTNSEKRECYEMTPSFGFCPLCGWKPGDGVKTCYYSSEVGAVVHQNSDEDAKKLMSASQRSLVESYESYHCGVMNDKTCDEIKKYLITLVKMEKNYWTIYNNLFSIEKYSNPMQVAEAWIGDKRSLEKYLAMSYNILREEKYVRLSYKRILDDYNGEIIEYELRLPHICGGYGLHLGPYHIGCSGCKEEVKLWEFGIDYDIG